MILKVGKVNKFVLIVLWFGTAVGYYFLFLRNIECYVNLWRIELLGKKLIETGETLTISSMDKVLTDLDRCINSMPTDVYPLILKGDLLVYMKRYNAAKVYYEKSLDIMVRPKVLFNLGYIYRLLGEDKKGDQYILRASKLDPTLQSRLTNIVVE